MGLDAQGIDPLAPLHERSWASPEQEEEYMERVKAKAKDAARTILAQAMTQAETIKEEAYQQGYEQGRTAASQEQEGYEQERASKLGDLIQGLQQETQAVRARQCKDMALLLKAAAEKVVATELKTHSLSILENLLHEALQLIDSREHLTISCAPADTAFLEDLLARTSQAYPGLEQWIVKSSPALEPGGLKVESRNGMVDNSIASRYALVSEIIEQVNLENDQ
ncbi:MAG: hypothetical protein CSA21_02290 [Deltaproteobacteria bacterium]|nr:MAG: hypothetical protein CSA21_02290 [Deltaproteobacteria bacterium]